MIELMVAVAMVAIISAIAIPNLRALLVRAEVRTAVNDWVSALQFAKSEAIKQNQQVTLCPSKGATDGGIQCSSTSDYEGGWIVKTGTTALVTGDRILADYPPLPKITMTSNKANAAAAVTYLANGLPIGNFAGMRIITMENAADPNTTLTRYICVARTGRARVFNEEQYLSLPNGDCE